MMLQLQHIIVQYSNKLSYLEYYKKNAKYGLSEYSINSREHLMIGGCTYNWRTPRDLGSIWNKYVHEAGYSCPKNYTL
jgi:hypothetical protein